MDDNEDCVYRASIRTRSGRRIFARQYGLKAFRIRVRKKPKDDQLKLPNLD